MSSVDELCRSYLDLKYHFDPAAGSAAGLTTEDSRLGRFDPETTREHLSALRSLTGALEELDPDTLEKEIDRTALLGELRTGIYRLEHERPHLRNPAFWLTHLFQGLYAVMARDDFDPAARASALVARLEAAPGFVSAARATLDRPPLVFVDTALAMLGGGGELIAQAATFFGQASPDAAGQLKQAGEQALRALVEFGAALRSEIEPDADPHAFAVGEEQFARRLHHEHAILAEPSELQRYGTRLQEEITGDIAEASRRLDSGPWREVVARLRKDAPPPGDLLAAYSAEVERASAFVAEHDLVGVPSGGVDVVPTPAFLASLVPFAAYEPPPVFLPRRTGRFYVTEPNPATRPASASPHSRHGIPVMVAHEVYPGHHLHLAIAEDSDSEVRRHIRSPVMVEGWALYSEQLMQEEGYYSSEEARLLQLVNLLWRAIRVVLDVGLHTRGMTPAAAVDYMVEHMPIDPHDAAAEVRRYCSWPTYQLSYAVGRRELLSLRQAYRERDPGGFTARRFHDELMRYGGLPVSLARWGMGLAE